MALLSVAAGWTGVLGPFTLKIDGATVDLSGMTVTLILHKWNDTTTEAGGTVTVDPDQVTNRGQVSYSPVDTDFTWTAGVTVKQIYQLRWKVVDGFGKVVYFPNGEAEQVAVYQA